MEGRIKTNLESNIPRILAIVVLICSLWHIFIAVLPLFNIKLSFLSVLAPEEYRFLVNDRNASIIINIIFGFLLIVSSKGLFEHKGGSWLLSTILISLSTLINFCCSEIPILGIIDIFIVALLVINRKHFYIKTFNEHLWIKLLFALLSASTALIYGIAGSYHFREQFSNLKTIKDAIYYTIETYSTVGYGDIVPVTQEAKFFATTMIIIGLGAFATVFSFFIIPIIQNRMKGVIQSMIKIANMNNHVIICGYNKLTKILVDKYVRTTRNYIIIDYSAEKLSEFDNSMVTVRGSISSKETFLKARLLQAGAIVFAFDDDSLNILGLLTVKEILEKESGKKPKLVVRIENYDNISKAKKIGADEVISPTEMAATSMLEITG